MWFQQIIRTFFFSLDSTLFNFIPTVYDLLITISRTTILTQGQIKQFADRIQMLLGVFMLFKVSFSLITYIINPDDFSDKSKGFGKLWMNIIISLIMLVIVPYIFSMAYQLQGMLLEENTLATLILGETEESKNANYIDTAGQKMAYTVMLPFFLPNSSLDGLNSCANLINAAGDPNDECFAAMQEKGDHLNQDGVDPTIENYKMGIQNQSLGLTFRLDIAKVTVGGNNGESQFLIDYKIPVSTVVAVVVLLLLISFCMDIALRSVKLSFLQLVYPIPVISFIDPKSGKDGIFKKWYEMCFKTYISLFVRLVALYFGVYVISKVNGMTDIVNGSQVTDFWVQIFIIIGVLMFMKQLPKILEGLGIKLDGDGKFQLNPFKKFEDEAIGGKRITGAMAGAAAGTVGMLTGAGLARGLTGAVGGFVGGKGFTEGLKNTASKNSALRSLNRIDPFVLTQPSTWFHPIRRTAGRLSASVSSTIGAPTRAEQIESRVNQIDEQIKDIDNQMAPSKKLIEEKELYANAVSEMEKRAISKIENGEAGQLSTVYRQKQAHIDTLKTQLDQMARTPLPASTDPDYAKKKAKLDSDLKSLETQIANAENDSRNFLNDKAMKAYIDANRGKKVKVDGVDYEAKDIFGVDGSGKAKSDGALENLTLKMESIVDTYGKNHSSMQKGSADTIHASMGTIKGEVSEIQRENEKYENRKRELNEDKSKEYEQQRRYKSYQDAVK